MQKLILEWKRLADKYQELGRKADHDLIRQEGLLCRSEVYNYCASRLEDCLQQKDSSAVERNSRKENKMESPKKHFMVARDMAETKAFERMNRKNAEPGVEADVKCVHKFALLEGMHCILCCEPLHGERTA